MADAQSSQFYRRIMTDTDIANCFKRILEARGRSYSPDSRLLGDLGLDSQDLVGIVLEFERILDKDLDDSTILMFARSPLGEISARLGRLIAENGTD